MLFTHQALKLLKITKRITYISEYGIHSNSEPRIRVSDVCAGEQPFYYNNISNNANYLNILPKSAMFNLYTISVKNKSLYTLVIGTGSIGIDIQGKTTKKSEYYDKCFSKVNSWKYTESSIGTQSWSDATLNGVEVGNLKHKIMNDGHGHSQSHYIFKLDDTFVDINEVNDNIDYLLQLYQTSLIDVKNACWIRHQYKNREYLFSLLPRDIINIIANEIYLEAWELTIKVIKEISQMKCYKD
jgi:hypothetical protein